MRLSKWQIELLAFEIARDLVKSGSVVVSADPERLEGIVHQVLLDDLASEEKLDVEVAQILKTHEATMRATGVDYATMFEKVKKQLVRERKLVL
jgi:hypothetical protein